MKQQIFITGTDTEVGKTYTTCLLAKSFLAEGKRVNVYKPVAAGCELVDGQWKNEDALALMEASKTSQTYAQVNPVALPEAIAPHIAAKLNKEELSVKRLSAAVPTLEAMDADIGLIEGAGGWLVPLNESESLADLVAARGWPVILVVGLKLGCINHTLLTVEAIKQRGLAVIGWVANQLHPEMEVQQENIETLSNLVSAPLLGVIGYNEEHLFDTKLVQSFNLQ